MVGWEGCLGHGGGARVLALAVGLAVGVLGGARLGRAAAALVPAAGHGRGYDVK